MPLTIDELLDPERNEQIFRNTEPVEMQPPARSRPGLCERTGGHVCQPAEWPPRKNSRGKKVTTARCKRCGCHVTIPYPAPKSIHVLPAPEPEEVSA